MRTSSGLRVKQNTMSAPALAKASPRRIASSMPPARRALVRAMITRFGIGARRERLLELLDEELGRHQVVDADVMLDPARQELVLDLDRREAGGLRERDGAMHVHRIAPAAAGVEHQRQLAGGADVDRDVGHLGQRQIRLGDALDPAERAAGEIDRLEARVLGIRAMIGLQTTGATMRSLPRIRSLSLSKSVLPLSSLKGSMRHGGTVAKLKIMCARSMHEVVTALAYDFRRDTGTRPS